MINLIIDAANEKIVFVIINGNQSYTSYHINSRENFDNFVILLINFLKKKKISIKNINKIFINLGPGKFTSLRISLSIAKALSLANKATLIGYKTTDLTNENYKNLLKLENKKLLNKSLIKPVYLS